MKNIFLLLLLIFITSNLYSQEKEKYKLTVTSRIESTELFDLLMFENIFYKKVKITGADLKGKFYVITVSEYWDKELLKTDTITNTKEFGLPNNSDELELRVISKKTSSDSVKFQFFQPALAVIRKFKTTDDNTYSLRDPSDGKEINLNLKEKVAVLSYSLPYKDPAKPGYLFYCALSSDGVPPGDWGTKYGVPHYIVFEIEIIE